ncbi:MAG: alkaline phosphatase family protein, partial [Ferrovum sp.]|nr:alkaline phosphatase family protein [Ferrovum sp.]
IIYDENVSFDHYFGTYPQALNPPGSPRFTARSSNITINGLRVVPVPTNPDPEADPKPFRLDRSDAVTSDQAHAYGAEQKAFNEGRMNHFSRSLGNPSPQASGPLGSSAAVMGYYDGNTVTALWFYAQQYSMNDAAFTDTFGPSTPGALEVVAGQTNGLERDPQNKSDISVTLPDGQGGWTLIGDTDPIGDVCSHSALKVRMKGPHVGDLLDQQQITWGSFMGGFDLTRTNPNGSTGCQRSTRSPVSGKTIRDYVPHHSWFQYYASSANPTHARPVSLNTIGQGILEDGNTPEPAHHQYDLEDFFSAVETGHFPAVSYLKAPASQNGHAGYSNPLDEQHFLVRIMNFLQRRKEWANTAVIITYDDSDGWYDHAMNPTTHASYDPQADHLNGPGRCGTTPPPLGIEGKPVNGRCGPGPRIPFLLLSPWARANAIDHTPISQASIVRFIEDNWLQGKRLGRGSFDAEAGNIENLFDFQRKSPLPPLFLDPESGLPVPSPEATP